MVNLHPSPATEPQRPRVGESPRVTLSGHWYKAHVGADADTALVEQLSVTPGNVHDGQAGHGALPDDPGDVLADSGYRGQIFMADVLAWLPYWHGCCAGQGRGAENRSDQRVGPPRRRHGKETQELELQRPTGRCRIEKIFEIWKRSYGLRRMRWRGLLKATLQVRLTAIAYNLKRTATILKAANA